jgi:hypothetical protein
MASTDASRNEEIALIKALTLIRVYHLQSIDIRGLNAQIFCHTTPIPASPKVLMESHEPRTTAKSPAIAGGDEVNTETSIKEQ